MKSTGEVIMRKNNDTERPCTLIYLHGFGDDAMSTKELLKAAVPDNFRVLLPNADLRVSVNGEEFPSWYHYLDDELDAVDPETLGQSAVRISALVEKELRSTAIPVDSSNIFLGGSSQGAGVAFHAFAASSHRLGGFIGCRGCILDETPLPWNIGLGSAICFSHGEDDPVIEASWMQGTVARLSQSLNVHVDIHPGVDHDPGELEADWVSVYLQAMV